MASTRGRIFLLLFIVLIPVFLVQTSVYLHRFNDQLNDELENNLEVARSVRDTFEQFIDDVLHQERTIAVSLTSPLPQSPAQIRRLLGESQREYGVISSMTWVNSQGRVEASSQDAYVGMDISDRPYFQEIVRGRESVVSDLIQSRFTGRPVFVISRALRENGDLRGVVVAGVMAERLDGMLALERFDDGAIGILDKNGNIVSRYPHLDMSWDKRTAIKTRPAVLDSLRGNEATSTSLSLDGSDRITGLVPIRSLGWAVFASRPRESVTAPILTHLLYDAGLLFFVSCASFLMASFISRKISGPIKSLRDQARALGRGEAKIPVRISGTVELEQLADSFNKMAVQINSREADLLQANENLETRVRERTEDLETMNNTLGAEILERKRAQEMLQERNELLEGIFSNIHFLVAYMDNDFNFIRVNEAYAKSEGKSPEFFAGKNHFALYPDEENRRIFEQVVKTGMTYHAHEKPFEFADHPEWGTSYWDWTLQPVKLPNGQVSGLVLSLIDVTRRKLAEKQISDERQRFFSILDKLPASVHLYASDCTIKYANRYLVERFGDPTGKFCFELLQGRERPCEDCVPKQVLATKKPASTQWMDSRSGRFYNLSAYPFTDVDGSEAVLELGLDVTETIKAEETLKIYMGKLERSNQDLQDFAYSASHDIQEPLRKIILFSRTLSDRYKETLDERGRDYLRRMGNAASRMSEMIQALLDYSRVSTRANPFVSVDLGRSARKALSNLLVRIEETKGHVDVGELPSIEAEPNQMTQLFQNLIGNALKFHKPGTPPLVRVGGEITNGEGKNGRFCRISVEDNGIGFEEKYLDRIFSPFQRLHGKNEYEGTGIGLATCRKIVERHGGSITAKSQEGVGSVFIVELPLERRKDAEIILLPATS